VWIGWLLAAALDCADGQLARVARQTSPPGAVLDILCDVLSQAMFVAALAAVASVSQPGVPAAVYAFAGGIWMMVLVTAQLDKDGADVSLLPAESLPLSVLKAPRDLITQITAAAVAIAVWPDGMLWLIGGLTAVNSIYLIALIARATLRSTSGHESRPQPTGAEVQKPQIADLH
jgi:phosphatidylglycerophosphate synthase